MKNDLSNLIKQKALSLGYDKCGIIPVSDMRDYADKLSERIEKFPELKPHFNELYNFANIENNYSWAKSVVICVRHYGKYIIPHHLNGLIAKYYLLDSRLDTASNDYKASVLFEDFLLNQDIKCATNRKFGITALRWAAMKAGLGIIRNNNFFYTEKGSWVYLEAWIIDKELLSREENKLKPCTLNCNLCIKSCPTNSLNAPFSMNRSKCISCITTWEGRDMPNEQYKKELGNWIYGCDICQDVCPHNKNKWLNIEEFPSLKNVSEYIRLEKIVKLDYETLKNIIQPKFWYIDKVDVWKLKVNALNAMLNSGEERYHKYIEQACYDDHEKVREMAKYIKSYLNI